MPRKVATLATPLLLFAPLMAHGQDAPSVPAPVAAPPVAAPKPRPATVRVTMMTGEGPITLELEKERAPLTTANFLKYADTKRLDGSVFYRALNLAPGYGLVQGGLQNDPRKLLKPVPHEPTSKTGLTHGEGTISMARREPGSATADFFIVLGDMKSLDADPAAPGDNQGFAAFGKVVEGMDVVKRILAAPTSATAREAAMKGQMIAAPIRIVSVRRAPAVAP